MPQLLGFACAQPNLPATGYEIGRIDSDYFDEQDFDISAQLPSVERSVGTTALPHYAFLDRLAALSFVDALVLYGSRARGDQRERSDIDLAVLAPRASDSQWREVLEIIDCRYFADNRLCAPGFVAGR